MCFIDPVAANALFTAISISFLFIFFSLWNCATFGGCASLPPLAPLTVAPTQKNCVPLLHIIFLGILDIPCPYCVFHICLLCFAIPLALYFIPDHNPGAYGFCSLLISKYLCAISSLILSE